jgi:hypothetical protein
MGAARAARLGVKFVRRTGPLLSNDPERRKRTAENAGTGPDADDLALERGRRFDDRCTLSHESP